MSYHIPNAGSRDGEPVPADRPPGEWRPLWCPFRGLQAPVATEEILVWREGWDKPMRWENMHPMQNIEGLMWQAVGGRHRD